jgi:hypothetical protein
MPVVERTKFWTKQRDDFLRQNYHSKQHTDPACLAMTLHTQERIVISRLSKLGLRHKMLCPDVQRRQ